ncbi:MAG: DNA-directed RNA polymerase subunit beta' [Collinsella sp.]|nr:DNA-directed RNA polymerase subunit beta' [Collinsella sp.]
MADFEATEFDSVKISLASADQIRSWSHGEVKKPETINYRTLKPEKDGLFCEKIFGPAKDWECSCGKYKGIRFKGIVCERCGVEVTSAKVRRDRMGHIELAAPVSHIWYFKSPTSFPMSRMLDIKSKDLEKVLYFASYIITEVDYEAREADADDLREELAADLEEIDAECARQIESLKEQGNPENFDEFSDEEPLTPEEIASGIVDIEEECKDEKQLRTDAFNAFMKLTERDLISDEPLFREMTRYYSMYFKGGMGAEAVRDLLAAIDLPSEAEKLKAIIADEDSQKQKREKAVKRLEVVDAFLKGGNSPANMILDVIPVIPPDLRPMVQLDGGRFAASDLNDLYRRVINRNNRLKRLLDLDAPAIIVNNEKRMLQESVDALFDNGRRGRPVAGPGNRPLKSISDMLKGKQGRFRQNLLGKRVDYSGRSVIVVGPQLKLHQCGLPKQMALELFKPFVMKRLVEKNYAQNVKAAKRKVERQRPEVWDVLDDVIREHPVLLNRAPTLHRLGIQAFEPQLIEGKAIQLHPLACGAFNADFDGDQMAVHLPLGAEAQAEARILMLSTNNILKPSDGRPVAMPSQDMIIGLFHLTSEPDPALEVAVDAEGAPVVPSYSSVAEAIMSFDKGDLDLNAKARIRFAGIVPPVDWEAPEGWEPGDDVVLETSLGRAIFNEQLPVDYPFVNEVVGKKQLGRIVNTLTQRYPNVLVAECLDALKSAGFHWSTWSGITIAFSDIQASPRKEEILASYEQRAAEIQDQFDMGFIEEDSRYEELVKLWLECTEKVAEDMRANFDERNTVYRMVNSGARGNWSQVQQLAGMRGLVSDPKQKLIERPIKANYREGLTVLEYFIATHGARKGLADTALRTAESGYLTRRLVDVSQDVIVREADCGTRLGVRIKIAEKNETGQWVAVDTVETTAYARNLAQDAVNEAGEVVFPAGSDLGDEELAQLVAAGVESVVCRSVLTCESQVGTCAACYGRSLATGKQVDIGEAVGIIAAQSIGEPGTQLTMRTFHTGGAASAADITQGLPRVQELFEARTPKAEAKMAEAAGRVHIDDDNASARRIIITRDDAMEDDVIEVSRRQKLLVEEGQHVDAGQPLTEGQLDPKEVVRIMGRNVAQKQLVDEVQKVYRDQGVGIHSKHIEVVVRQMLRRVTVLESGDTDFLPGERVDRMAYLAQNRKVAAEGGQPASARQELMGITKASLATDSWLSAASFQETTKVLTEAAMNGKSDSLVGLKENVILGKLIPAGTGLARYNRVTVEPTADALANSNYSEMDFTTGGVSEDFLDALGSIDFGMTFHE